MGRLTEVETTNGENTDAVAYTYDKVGNRVSKTTEDTKVSYDYNGLNQLTSSEEKTKDGNGDYSQLAASTAYTYDAKGNEITQSETRGSTQTVTNNDYTVDSMLSGTTIQTGGGTTLTQENTYNGGGQRVSKTENGTATNYFYQDGSVLYTTDSSGAKTTQNFLTTAGSTMAAARYGASDISYYTYNKDIRNSTVSILDETGAVATKYSYDEFGQTTVDGDYTFSNEICYTGGIYDWASGQYYLNARYYDPEIGRFLSEDTYRGDVNDPDTLHLYAYCANNPINYADPSGHNPLVGALAEGLIISVDVLIIGTYVLGVLIIGGIVMDYFHHGGGKYQVKIEKDPPQPYMGKKGIQSMKERWKTGCKKGSSTWVKNQAIC